MSFEKRFFFVYVLKFYLCITGSVSSDQCTTPSIYYSDVSAFVCCPFGGILAAWTDRILLKGPLSHVSQIL